MRPNFVGDNAAYAHTHAFAFASSIAVAAAVRAALWTALRPGPDVDAAAWCDERAAARERLRSALAAAGAAPAGLELVDVCAGADIDDAPGAEIYIGEIVAAAAADEAADPTDGAARRLIAAFAVGGMPMAEIFAGVAGDVEAAAVASAIADARRDLESDDESIYADCDSECDGCDSCDPPPSRADFDRAAASAPGRLSVADIALGRATVARLAAAAFVAEAEVAAAAALELTRRADAPAALALAAVYSVVHSGCASPATFGDFSAVADRLASRLLA